MSSAVQTACAISSDRPNTWPSSALFSAALRMSRLRSPQPSTVTTRFFPIASTRTASIFCTRVRSSPSAILRMPASCLTSERRDDVQLAGRETRQAGSWVRLKKAGLARVDVDDAEATGGVLGWLIPLAAFKC